MHGNTTQIYVETPLIYSKHLSDIISKPVYMKLENTQPSGSFKLRGISELCKQKIKNGCKELVGASGGNAGLALAYTAHHLIVPCRIFVPTNTSSSILDKICSYGAKVTVTGHDFKMAHSEAIKFAEEHPGAGFIHPYDHPAIWDGNSTIVNELKKQLNGVRPSCIVASVGGGGLLLGILKGLQNAGWEDIPVIAVETEGSDCFNRAILAGDIVEVTISSVAKSLGARTVCPTLLKLHPEFNIISKVLSDKAAVNGCLRFADAHQYLVEPACGVTLATVYEKLIPSALQERGFALESDAPIILVICGGSDCTPQTLRELSHQFALAN